MSRLAAALAFVTGCGASAAGPSEPTARLAPPPNTCGGCQIAMGDTCMRIVGAAPDRAGVTIARLCEPWCCQLTSTELGDVGYVSYVDADRWSVCPDAEHAPAPGATPGGIDGTVLEQGDLLVPRATVVLAGGDQTRAETTGDDGRFRFDGLAAGHYALTVYYGDVVFKQQCLRVLAGERTELDVDLDVQIRTDRFFIVE
jgi:hypothetical protein